MQSYHSCPNLLLGEYNTDTTVPSSYASMALDVESSRASTPRQTSAMVNVGSTGGTWSLQTAPTNTSTTGSQQLNRSHSEGNLLAAQLQQEIATGIPIASAVRPSRPASQLLHMTPMQPVNQSHTNQSNALLDVKRTPIDAPHLHRSASDASVASCTSSSTGSVPSTSSYMDSSYTALSSSDPSLSRIHRSMSSASLASTRSSDRATRSQPASSPLQLSTESSPVSPSRSSGAVFSLLKATKHRVAGSVLDLPSRTKRTGKLSE